MSLFLTLGFVSLASAFPKETARAREANFVVDGWTPKPTTAPYIGLRKRQATTTATGNTCGYVSGMQSNPIICPAGATCTTDSVNSAVGCCTGSGPDCMVATACYDFRAAASCNQNTNGCGKGMYCTESTLAYCNTYTFTDNHFTDYFCFHEGHGVQQARVDWVPPPGLTTAQKVGIGVGAGVSVPAMSFLFAFICIPSFRKRVKQMVLNYIHHDQSTHIKGDDIHSGATKQGGDQVMGGKSEMTSLTSPTSPASPVPVSGGEPIPIEPAPEPAAIPKSPPMAVQG